MCENRKRCTVLCGARQRGGKQLASTGTPTVPGDAGAHTTARAREHRYVHDVDTWISTCCGPLTTACSLHVIGCCCTACHAMVSFEPPDWTTIFVKTVVLRGQAVRRPKSKQQHSYHPCACTHKHTHAQSHKHTHTHTHGTHTPVRVVVAARGEGVRLEHAVRVRLGHDAVNPDVGVGLALQAGEARRGGGLHGGGTPLPRRRSPVSCPTRTTCRSSTRA
jgi:hypothetical protein